MAQKTYLSLRRCCLIPNRGSLENSAAKIKALALSAQWKRGHQTSLSLRWLPGTVTPVRSSDFWLQAPEITSELESSSVGKKQLPSDQSPAGLEGLKGRALGMHLLHRAGFWSKSRPSSLNTR